MVAHHDLSREGPRGLVAEHTNPTIEHVGIATRGREEVYLGSRSTTAIERLWATQCYARLGECAVGFVPQMHDHVTQG
jgi:hypothetical protein